MKSYTYAVQIQPRTGQQLAECKDLEIDPREWSEADRKRYPAAEKSP